MYIYDGRTSFYQWDTNQKIVSENFKVGEEVHFFNLRQPNALVVLAYKFNGEVVADVPNILLQSSYPIIVYRMTTDREGRYTREEYTFKVNQRAKPIDYIYTETEVFTYKTLEQRINEIEKNGVSDEQIATAVTDYLERNPVDVGSSATIGWVELLANKWVGTGSLYSQVVSITGVTENSQVDLTPSVDQLVVFYEKDLSFVTENDGGIVTVYAIGQKPVNDYTIQVTITEVYR